jgi:hypothetical protein
MEGSPMSDHFTDGEVQSVEIVLQDWCDWCNSEGVELTHKIDATRFDFSARFCSLQCATRWGCATDQEKIEDIVSLKERSPGTDID